MEDFLAYLEFLEASAGSVSLLTDSARGSVEDLGELKGDLGECTGDLGVTSAAIVFAVSRCKNRKSK